MPFAERPLLQGREKGGGKIHPCGAMDFASSHGTSDNGQGRREPVRAPGYFIAPGPSGQ